MLTSSFQILTNNPKVVATYGDTFRVESMTDATDREVLMRARDLVHRGHRILSAPLSGSVKPWETPYRSILVTTDKGERMDMFSFDIMERALAIIRDHPTRPEGPIAPAILQDFQVIDLSLVASALESMEATGRAPLVSAN